MLSKNSIYLLEKRYCHKGETPEDVFKRVAYRLSNGDEKFEEKLFNLMINGVFLPNSPTLYNAGYKDDASYFACFVVPIEDSIDSIFDAVKTMAKIFQSGGGTGFSFSNLRPKNSVLSRGGVSSGPISFIKQFDTVVETVKQGGYRRGAAMASLRCDHPDILEFCKSKINNNLQNFNISVAATDDFMKKISTNKSIDLYHPKVGKTSSIKAKDLFDIISFCAWNSGDPGMLFIDTINKTNPFYPNEIIEATNPCVTGDVLVVTPNGEKRVDQIKIGDSIIIKYRKIARNNYSNFGIGYIKSIETHLNTDVYELTYLDDCIKKRTIKTTKSHQFYTNNGNQTINTESIIALLDNNIIPSVETCDGETSIISYKYVGKETVYDLYEEKSDTWITNDLISRGCGEVPLLPNMACNLGSINLSKFVRKNEFDFERFDEVCEFATNVLLNVNKLSGFPIPEIKTMVERTNAIGVGIMGFADAMIKLGIFYNSQECLDFIDKIGKIYKESTERVKPEEFHFYHRVIAPVGSLSILSDSSSGIEPVFDNVFERNLTIGKIEEARDIYKSEYCVTAHQISPEWHVKVQAAFQRWTDAAVSKCLLGSTRIQTDKGVFPIEYFHKSKVRGFMKVEEEYYVFDKDKNKKRILNGYYDGNGIIKSIRLNNGFTINSSENHKFLTAYGWKAAKDIKVNDFLLFFGHIEMMCEEVPITIEINSRITNTNSFPKLPSTLSKEFAKWIGMILSDGCLTESTGYAGIFEKNKIVGDVFDELTFSVFGVYPKKTTDKRNGVVSHYLTSRGLVRFLKNFIGFRSKDKHLPNEIFNSPKEVKLAIIEGITLDGYNRNNYLIIYEGTSLELRNGLIELCLSLGMETTASKKKVNKYNYYTYSVGVYTNTNSTFCPIEHHKVLSNKNRQNVYYLGDLDLNKYRTPVCINGKWSNKYYSWLRLYTSKNNNMVTKVTNQKTSYLSNIGIDVNSLIKCYKVLEIVEGTGELYDIEIDGDNTYLLNGILTHNTVNLPHDASVDDVKTIYKLAWELGCKGCTVYVDGSKNNQVLTNKSVEVVKKPKCSDEECSL